MNESYHRKKVSDGRAFIGISESIGFKEVYIKRLQEMLAEADRRVHDRRLRDENGKYFLGLYDGLKNSINEQEVILNEMKNGISWLREKGISIEE